MPESRAQIAELKSRWSRVATDTRAAMVDESATPFGMTEGGLHDLRGIRLRGAINRLSIARVDLAYSEMGTDGQLGGGFNAAACRFDSCRYESTLDGTFEDCTFIEARLARCTIRKVFRTCNFSNARMEYVAGDGLLFESCDFSDTNLRRAQLYRCEFIRCRFSGTKFRGAALTGSRFVECTFEDVELVDAILDKVDGLQG